MGVGIPRGRHGGGRDGNPTPNNAGEDADEIEACTEVFYAGIGTRDRRGCRTKADYGMAAQPRSPHPGGVKACFADGHVQSIRYAIGLRAWPLHQSANDGQDIGGDY